MAASREETYRTIGKLVAALVAAGVLIAGLALPYVGGLGLVAGREADKFQDTTCDLKDSKPPQRTTLYARDGKTVVATLFNQNRVEIGLKDVPKTLQQALVATEDRRFFQHHGVDMRGLVRSAVNTTSGDTQGGSTLTMQYVKQVRYYEAGDDIKRQQAAVAQNLNRKIEDAKCAIYIEETLKKSKQQILQNYLNIAFFGENSYGIQTAAKTYFNKNASQLEPEESALLVGLLRAPSAYDPFTNRVAAKERRDAVLQNMVATKDFTQAEANRYKAMPISLASDGPPLVRQGCTGSATTVENSGFFCDYVRQWLINVAKISDQDLQTGGYKVITTLDPKLQNASQTAVQKRVPASSSYTAVLPVIEPRTGDVLAMASSKQFGVGKNETVQPLFSRPVAQAASTFKLFPLLAALEYGMPADWPLRTVGGNGEVFKSGSCLTPMKASNGDPNVNYNQTETLRSAMVKSSNTFFLGASDQFFNCEISEMVSIAQRLGISNLSEKVGNTTVAQEIVNKQLAQQFTLGVPSASPLAIAGAYAGVANEGMFNAPSPVTMVYDSDNNAVDTRRQAGVQAVPAETAMQAVDIMRGETRGQGTSAAQFASWYSAGGSDIAGKTGTAQAGPKGKQNGAIWFIGMTPQLVGASAIADFDSPSTPQSGLPGVKNADAYGEYAAKVWLSALRSTLSGDKWTWTDPDEVEGKTVPNVVGDGLSAAKAKLTEAGYKVQVAGADAGASGAQCASSVAPQDVGYYGPKRAPEGTTIIVCQSSGTKQDVPAPPAPPRNNGRNRDRGNDRNNDDNDRGNDRGNNRGNNRGNDRNNDDNGGNNRRGGGN